MFNWIKNLFSVACHHIEISPIDYCEEKSDQELIKQLSDQELIQTLKERKNLSLRTGNTIVCELLDRLIRKCDQFTSR